tara:strand:+ start:155 stop:346 length:192 start_codon:yes stop_codon:yes gene_type:complete
MQLIDVERPIRKVVPDPILAAKVSREVQKAFDQLATKNYRCTRAELLRAIVIDFIKRHEVEIK